jgi:predicted negative regulator of RcsB-dependent stress response
MPPLSGVNIVPNNEPTSQKQTPVEKPEFSLENFEPDVFWKEHGRQITWGIAIALFLGLVAYLYQLQTAQKAEAAATRLAEAQTPDDLEKIIKANFSPEISAQALLRLADLQFQQGKYAQADSTYKQFLSAYPQHTLADAARLGLASVLEAEGKYNEARQEYNTLAGKRQSFTSLSARIGYARCTELLGDTKEARKLYEELMPVVQNTAWQNVVYMRWMVLGRNLPKEVPVPASALPTGIVPLSVAPAGR